MLDVAVGGGIATLTLNRPEKRNALSIELREALAGALAQVGGDDAVRCTIITGAGSAFCAGMDTSQFGMGEPLVTSTEAMVDAILAHPKPLVADVNGPALGGGFVVALLCDIRVARPGAEFGFPEVERGIPASYGAAATALPHGLAAYLCLTGEILNYRQAIAYGVGVADNPAGKIAGLPPRPWMRTPHPALMQEREAFRAAVLKD
jgi:enoyl-CoA hydratase/carnithine racemase